MGREEGGGLRMGNTCIPVADHVDIWKNQYNIVKLKNKIKLKKNNKKNSKNKSCKTHAPGLSYPNVGELLRFIYQQMPVIRLTFRDF